VEAICEGDSEALEEPALPGRRKRRSSRRGLAENSGTMLGHFHVLRHHLRRRKKILRV
jgi:hypothetical protein